MDYFRFRLRKWIDSALQAESVRCNWEYHVLNATTKLQKKKNLKMIRWTIRVEWENVWRKENKIARIYCQGIVHITRLIYLLPSILRSLRACVCVMRARFLSQLFAFDLNKNTQNRNIAVFCFVSFCLYLFRWARCLFLFLSFNAAQRSLLDSSFSVQRTCSQYRCLFLERISKKKIYIYISDTFAFFVCSFTTTNRLRSQTIGVWFQVNTNRTIVWKKSLHTCSWHRLI